MTTKFKAIIAAAVIGSVGFSASAETFYVNETAKVGTSVEAWNGGGNYSCEVTPLGGEKVKMVERYHGNGDLLVAGYTPLYQELTDLTNGTYKVTLYATAYHAWGVLGGEGLGDGVEDATANRVFAKAGEAEAKYVDIISKGGTSYTEAPSYVIDNVEVTDGKLTLGVEVVAKKANWYTIQIASLERVASEEEVAAAEKVAYEAALAELTTVKEEALALCESCYDADAEYIEAYKAIINADVPETSIEVKALISTIKNASEKEDIIASHAYADGNKDAVDYTSSIKNPIANEETNDWVLAQSDGGASIGIRNDQCPTLEGISNYFDGGNWGGTDWTVSFQQKVSVEAGKYRLSALARSSSDLRWLRLVVAPATDEAVANGETCEYPHADFPRLGDAGGYFERGWNIRSVDFEVGEEGAFTIAMQANSQKGQQWMSFTGFHLIKVDKDSTTGVEEITVEENAPVEYFNLQGVRVANPENGIFIKRAGDKVTKVIVK